MDWSKLRVDILRKILETLSPIDSHLAKMVCLHWYFVWRTCINRPPCPLRIMHQGHGSFYKEDKTYKTKLVGLPTQSSSYCMASFSNWLMLVDHCLDFNLLNMLTGDKISLPSLNSPFHGTQRLKENDSFVGPSSEDNMSKNVFGCKEPIVLWVNESAGEYVVAWIFKQRQLFTLKKGGGSWRNLSLQGANSGFLDVAYTNNKLYVFTADYHIKILDYTGNLPIEENNLNPYLNHPFDFVAQPCEYIWRRRIAIRKSGEVLIILSLKQVISKKQSLLFYVFKMNLESNKWEKVDSIGDKEMVIFGHGVTRRAPVKDCGDGIKSDSIYFVRDDIWPDLRCGSHCGVFDIATTSIKWPQKLCVYINKTQWFVPGLAY